MQTSLGRKGDYSVRATLFVAIRHGERQKARQIAEEMGIPLRYLTQILADLVQQGVLTATAGPSGGYCLARPPEETTLLEVVEAAEGPIGLERCILQGGPCSWEDSCPVHIPWARAQNAMAAELAATSLADLVKTADEIEKGTHTLPPDTPPHAFPTKRSPRRARGRRK